MKRLNLTSYAALLVLAALFSACSGPPPESGSSNTSAQPQANSNGAAAAPNPPPLAVQPIPPPPTPVEKSPANSNANSATAGAAAGNARVPRLVVSEKKIDYGKVPQEKTLVRTIVIKNGGLANLNIESVVPS
jgi:hypothetical protein